MQKIRRAVQKDAPRIAEIEIFNYRLNFYPIFRDDAFYFEELQVPKMAEAICSEPDVLNNTYVYDDGVVKGFFRTDGNELKKLFVEPVLQGQAVGSALMEYAVRELGVSSLWALEKNVRAIAFYEKHGFRLSGKRKPEEDTTEYLVQLIR